MNCTKNQFLKFKHIKSNLIYGKENITSTPLISIAIPTYNRPLLLKEAIESALNQKDFSNYEVIVVDNNPDSTVEEEVIKSFNNSRLFYYKNESNLGMTGNWNRCIELAKGKWVTILHDDDLLYPDFLREMSEIIRNNDNIDLLTCIAEVGDHPHSLKKNVLKKIKGEIKERIGIRKITLDRLLRSNINPFPGVLFKKDLALKLGGFDETFYPCADYAFWFKYCLKNQGFILYKTLSFYRISVNESQSMNTKLGIIEKTYQIQQTVMNNMHLNKLVKKMFTFISIGGLLYGYSARDKVFKESEKLKEIEKKIKISKLYKTKFLRRILVRFFIVVTKFYFICTGKNRTNIEEIYKDFNDFSTTTNA